MKRPGRVKPFVRVAAERAPQDVLDLARHIAPFGGQRRHVVGRLLRENLLRRLPAKRRPAQQSEIGDRGQRIQVGALVDALAQELLRRGELRGAAPRRRAAEPRAAAQRERQPEVRDPQPAVGIDQHVLRFQIAVNQAHAVRVFERRQRLVEQPFGLIERTRPMPLDHLRQTRAGDVLHGIPGEAGAALNVVDAHDVRMPQPRRELRLPTKPLRHARVRGERGMQDLDRHVALEGQVAGAIHPPEAAGADLLEQLVVVAQCAAQPPLGPRLGDDGRGGEHLKRAGIRHEVLEHLGRRVIAILGHARQRADDDALDRHRNRRALPAGRHDARRIGVGRIAGERGVNVRGHAVHVARGLARLARADFGRHKGRARVIGLQRREVGQAPVRIAQVGDDTLAAAVDHQGGGHDAAHDDRTRVGMLERRQQVADERHGLRDRARATTQRIGEAFAFDPVRRAIGERRDLAGGVDMANRGMVELGERFGLAHEPGASRGRFSTRSQP